MRSDVSIRRSARRVALLDASLPADLADTVSNRPDELVATGEQLRATNSRSTVQFEWGSQTYVLKRYMEPSWRHALKQLIQPSRASRTWKTCHRLADAGVATPRPVACIDCRWGPFRHDSYLMYPYVLGQSLAEYVAGEIRSTPELIDDCWKQLADLWQHLAQLRASLGDANLTNFIVSPAGRLWVIDLDKARFHRIPSLAAWHAKQRWKQVLRNAAKHSGRRELLRSA